MALPIILMVIFAATRWPGVMPDNFSAVYAVAFCAGVFFPAGLAWWIPLTVLLGTDLYLSLFYYHSGTLDINYLIKACVYIAPNYLAYAVLIWLGKKFSSKASWWRLLCGGMAGAFVFYFITNTVSWLADPLYPKSLAGWIQALTIGTPGWPHTWEFFRNTLISGGLFTGLFAGAIKMAEASEAEEKEPETAENPEPEEKEPAEAPV